MKVTWLLSLCVGACSVTLAGQTCALEQRKAYETLSVTEKSEAGAFLRDLQTAVTKNDRVKVASLIKYPVEDHMSVPATEIDTEKDFLNHYNELFTPELERVLVSQVADKLLLDSSTFVVGNGEILFDEPSLEGGFKIVGFNVGKFAGALVPPRQTPEVYTLLGNLKLAIKNNDRNNVASMIGHYPLYAYIGHKRKTIKDKRDLLKYFSYVFNDAIRRAVLEQDPCGLQVVGSNGIMVGEHGEIWIYPARRNGPVRIMAINSREL